MINTDKKLIKTINESLRDLYKYDIFTGGAGYSYARNKAKNKFLPGYEEKEKVLLTAMEEIEELRQNLSLVDEKLKFKKKQIISCETEECIAKLRNEIKLLEANRTEILLQIKQIQDKNKVYTEAALLAIPLLMGGANLVGAAVGFIHGIKDADSIASAERIRQMGIKKVSANFEKEKERIMQKVKMYQDAYKNCTDSECVDRFTNKIEEALQQIEELDDNLDKIIDKINDEFEKKQMLRNQLFNPTDKELQKKRKSSFI